jgi:Cupredoxin-like domain
MNRPALPAAFAATLALAVSALVHPAAQAAPPEYKLVIKDHRFMPTELEVPAGQKIRLVVENQDPTPEEFESYDLNREKIVAGNGTIVLFVGPLKPGKYEFFGEFNMATARGWLVAR